MNAAFDTMLDDVVVRKTMAHFAKTLHTRIVLFISEYTRSNVFHWICDDFLLGKDKRPPRQTI